jgi:hypothetical protein
MRSEATFKLEEVTIVEQQKEKLSHQLGIRFLQVGKDGHFSYFFAKKIDAAKTNSSVQTRQWC